MAKFMSLKPMLYTKQIQETINFYIDILGFECVAYEEEWAGLH